MGSEEEAHALLATLPVLDPLASVNEVLHWLESVAAEHVWVAAMREAGDDSVRVRVRWNQTTVADTRR